MKPNLNSRKMNNHRLSLTIQENLILSPEGPNALPKNFMRTRYTQGHAAAGTKATRKPESEHN